MTEAQVTKFLDAISSAEVKNFCFVDDITCYYKNSDSGVVVYDSGAKAIVSIQLNSATSAQYSNPLKFQMCDITDIHRAEVSGTYDDLKAFIEAFGINLDEDQLKVILRIDANNKILKPVTGDYTVTYHKLSDEEIAKLTPEEKEKYEENVKKDQERLVGLPKGCAGMVLDNQYNLSRSEYLK